MTDEERDIQEYEEWKDAHPREFYYLNSNQLSEKAWLEKARRDREMIERLKSIIRFIPDGWEMPLGFTNLVGKARKDGLI